MGINGPKWREKDKQKKTDNNSQKRIKKNINGQKQPSLNKHSQVQSSLAKFGQFQAKFSQNKPNLPKLTTKWVKGFPIKYHTYVGGQRH